MASQLFYFGLLFTITLIYISVKGADENGEPKIEPGLVLVPGPHQILVQPRTKSVLLNCSLNVTDPILLPLSYKWLKDGEWIDPSDTSHLKLKVQILSNGSLLLQPRKNRNHKKLDGLYDCLITTATKAVVIARRVEIVVASMSRNKSQEPSPEEAYRGGVARFECSILAKPVASYVWHRNDTQLPQDDHRFTSLPSGILQISEIDVSDAGMYWCQATTYLLTLQEQIANFGWKTGKRTELRVKSDSSARPPTLLAPPQNISVVVGHTAEFECFADGNPMPAVVWKKKDSDKVFGPQELYRHGNLRLVEVTPEDAGVYECTVSSRGQTIRSHATLTVLEPPKLEQGPESFSYPVAKAMTISCKVTGNPTPRISWYHNGIRINETDLVLEKKTDIKYGETLFLYTIQKKNSGFYQCIGENSVGQVMAVGLLQVFSKPGAPVAPKNVKCIAISSTSIMVNWDHMPNGSHPYVVSYQIVGDPKPPTQELCPARANDMKQQCELRNHIMPYTNYSVRVQAYNVKGASDITDKVYVRTLEDVPEVVPLVAVTSPLYHSMLVSWTPLTQAQSRGRVIAYKVYYRSVERQDETSKEVPADQTTFLIMGVEPEKTYEILVIASTSAGFTKRDKWPWTKYTTPPALASSPPRLEVRFINATTVWLEWQPPAISSTQPTENVIGYNLELINLSRSEEPARKFILASTVHSHTLTDLDSEQFYEVTLTAKTQQGLSSPATREFKLAELQSQLVPGNFHAVSVLSNSITIAWAAVPGAYVNYEICYYKELEKSNEQCTISDDVSVTISSLEIFTRYEFTVKALMDGLRGAASESLIIQTAEDAPSPPLNLTVEVRKNSVHLQWLPPTQPNGIITSYTIIYGREIVPDADIEWKMITQKGTDTSAQLDDLESGVYLFKLAAGNRIGQSPHTDIVTAVLTCSTPGSNPCSLVTESTKGSVPLGIPGSSEAPGITNAHIGMIMGSVVGLVCLLLLLLLVVWQCRRRCPSRNLASNTSQSLIYHGNGHISPPLERTGHYVPGNGHVDLIGSIQAGGRHEMINMHETDPMLTQIPENEHSDSKGGPDVITPSAFRANGVVKANHNIVAQVLHSHLPKEIINSHPSEECQGLIAAMLASAIENEIALDAKSEKIQMSSLNDIDRVESDESSQDSGLECRHAGMSGHREEEDTSPASSPLCSLERQQQGWERGREFDEIGGVFIDRSTGAVVGEVAPYNTDICKAEHAVEKGGRSRTCGDRTTVDGDSGRGSESKSHDDVQNFVGDNVNSFVGLNIVLPASLSNDVHPKEVIVGSPPQLPPPPSSALLTSSLLSQSSSSAPLSQQLQCSNSRNLSNNSRPQHDRRRHPQDVCQQISPTDLPPPLSSSTLPHCQGPLAAVKAASISEPISTGSNIDEEGRQRSHDRGSILSRQTTEGSAAVAILQSSPPPTAPLHIV